jgi:hypothetical protein
MTKKLLIALAATLPLAACAGYYGGPVGPGVAYDGYYDDYYGPINDGYWGDGDVFYYRNHAHGRYVADRSGHFRHDMGAPGNPGGPGPGGPGGHGFHPMHGMGPGPGGPHGGRGHH